MSTRFALLLITVLWAAIYLPGLGTRELQGEEARRVLPGRTMLQTGEWIVTRSGGKVYNRKPPLVNWMSAAAISLTGRMDEWTVRLPSTLMMLALALSAFVCLRGWLGQDKALLVALISLTNIGFIEKGRLIEIEALYMALFGIALVLWLGLRWSQRHLAAWLASGFVLGLGFLAKGPLHVLYFYAIAVSLLLAEGRVRELLGWRHLVGLATFFATWLPWAVLNAARNPQRDSGAVWIDQITHRLGFVEFDFINYLLQIPQSLINLLPWAIFLPLCWRKPGERKTENGKRKTLEERHAQWLHGLRRGLVWAFLPIALLPSSRPRFMLPLNLAAAILIAEALSTMSVAWLEKVGRWWQRGCFSISFLSLLVLGLSLWGFKITQPKPREYYDIAASMEIWWTACAALTVITVWLMRGNMKNCGATLCYRFAGALASLAICYAAGVGPVLASISGELRPFAARITAITGPSDPILLYRIDEHMWPFYLGLRCREIADIKQRPTEVRWLITTEALWKTQAPMLEKKLGPAKQVEPLTDPRSEERYVLVSL